MPIIIEVNVQTGEQIEREMTAKEISALPALAPEDQAFAANPVDKLKAFLAANPDVMALL